MNPTSLWLQTAAVVLTAAGGLWLHLKWHPSRREFSEGWDLVTGLPWLTVLHGMLITAAELLGRRSITGAQAVAEGWGWDGGMPERLLEGLAEEAALAHALLPGWPWALLLPPALVLLSWRVIRYPYRYGPRRQRPEERWLLAVTMLLSWAWLGLEVASTGAANLLPEWVEGLRLALRLVFEAVAVAFSQMVLIRLVVAWLEPEQPDDARDLGLAVEHAFARWRGVAVLAALNLPVLLLEASSLNAAGLGRWIHLEALLVFLMLPAAAARVPGPLKRQGTAALRGWLQAGLKVAGVLLTGAVLLALTRHASAVMLEQTGPEGWRTLLLLPVHGLVLATVRNWVFLALVLTLLRHALTPPASPGRSVS